MKKGMWKVTNSKFDVCKVLLKSGMTQKEVAENLGISICTVGFISRSETYEEYRENMYKQSSSYRKKVAREQQKKAETASKPAEEKKPEPQVIEYRQNVTIQATHYMMEEMRKANELLTLISNKLAFIVEELTK